MRFSVFAAALTLGCSSVPTPPPKTPAAPDGAIAKATPNTPTAAVRAVTPDAAAAGMPAASAASQTPRCALAGDAETMALTIAVPARTKSGLELRFEGISHDDYADGRFDVLATFRFRHGGQSSQRMPSTLVAHSADEVLGHCFQLVSATQRTAQVRVAPLAPPVPSVQHLGNGRCQPVPREHSPCNSSDGYCVLSWGKPGGYSSALFCRDGRWVIENERNLP
jgi:hypothetical protein